MVGTRRGSDGSNGHAFFNEMMEKFKDSKLNIEKTTAVLEEVKNRASSLSADHRIDFVKRCKVQLMDVAKTSRWDIADELLKFLRASLEPDETWPVTAVEEDLYSLYCEVLSPGRKKQGKVVLRLSDAVLSNAKWMSTIAQLLDLCIDAVTTTPSEQSFRPFVKVTAALLLTRKDNESHFRGKYELANSYCKVIRSAAFLFFVLLEGNRSNVATALSLFHKQVYCEQIWSQIKQATEISIQLSLSAATKILCEDESDSGKNFRESFTRNFSTAESKAFFSMSKDREESIREFVSKINSKLDAQTRCFTTNCRITPDGGQSFEAQVDWNIRALSIRKPSMDPIRVYYSSLRDAVNFDDRGFKAIFIKTAPELCTDELEFSFSDPDEYQTVKQAIENRTTSACSGQVLRKASRAFLLSHSARQPERKKRKSSVPPKNVLVRRTVSMNMGRCPKEFHIWAFLAERRRKQERSGSPEAGEKFMQGRTESEIPHALVEQKRLQSSSPAKASHENITADDAYGAKNAEDELPSENRKATVPARKNPRRQSRKEKNYKEADLTSLDDVDRPKKEERSGSSHGQPKGAPEPPMEKATRTKTKLVERASKRTPDSLAKGDLSAQVKHQSAPTRKKMGSEDVSKKQRTNTEKLHSGMELEPLQRLLKSRISGIREEKIILPHQELELERSEKQRIEGVHPSHDFMDIKGNSEDSEASSAEPVINRVQRILENVSDKDVQTPAGAESLSEESIYLKSYKSGESGSSNDGLCAEYTTHSLLDLDRDLSSVDYSEDSDSSVHSPAQHRNLYSTGYLVNTALKLQKSLVKKLSAKQAKRKAALKKSSHQYARGVIAAARASVRRAVQEHSKKLAVLEKQLNGIQSHEVFSSELPSKAQALMDNLSRAADASSLRKKMNAILLELEKGCAQDIKAMTLSKRNRSEDILRQMSALISKAK
ncbi:hypothetical protein NDN08_002250 [Rhodosorus marinus]|uniref:Uncharacterized protein n=1 Tax=Rhodosorus marinus TaxID=101924 RepID=A0AAV8UT68_9RHOD|nr:hypothetical protein NDN08_002250 [Rhodosorus marinus]